MSRYYFKYNDIDLTDIVGVRTVEINGLPARDVSSIDVWDMIGSVFDSVKNGDREISVTFLILVDRKRLRQEPNLLDGMIHDVKNALYTDQPAPLFLGREDRYIYAIADGDFEINELGEGVVECEVDFLCNDPLWYDIEVQNVELDGLEGLVVNNGDVPTTPVITIGVGGNTTFYQLENKNTKERILIGELPRVDKTTIKAQDVILFDECSDTVNWTQSQAGIDAGCATGGTLAITDDGGGICAGSFGSGNDTWKGACYRRSLDTPLKNFRVRANFNFNSTGSNGDPTKTETIKYEDDLSTSTSGSVTYTYTVKVNTSLNIRTGPGTCYRRIGGYKNGQKLTGTVVNGWLKHTYNGRTAYCCMQYITTTRHDNRSSSTICNFVTNKATALRSSANEWSTSKATIPSGTVIRCYVEEVTKTEGSGDNTSQVGTGFRKLQVKYKGKSGYVKISDMTRASEAGHTITYEQEGETADDKQGRLQLYGFSSNGVQLFSLSIIDDSEWYEATYPLVKVNGKDFLYEEKYVEPKAKQKRVESNNTVKYENILSGRLGNWNEYYGDIQIERKDNVWHAYMYKNGTGSAERYLQSSKVIDDTNSDEELSYLVIYIGTSDADKASGMAINEIKVQTLSDIEPAQHNIQHFAEGDVIEIDCGVPSVKLNGVERNDLVDIGSQFFDLDVGETEIKVASDDSNATLGVLFNEKFL